MLGVRLTKSLTLVIAARSMASAEKAVIVSGISFSRSCRMRAVTTISVDGTLGSSTTCAWAIAGVKAKVVVASSPAAALCMLPSHIPS